MMQVSLARRSEGTEKELLSLICDAVLTLDEHLGAKVPHQVEETGSIVFHSSSNASEFKNDNKEAQVTTSAAAKESEEFLDKDAEILRLIEERRSTPKEEKQRPEGT